MSRNSTTAASFVPEPLEPRTLLSAATPTAAEQYLLELLNRARAHPGSEAGQFGINLNEGLPAGTLANTPRQPLAWNALLTDAAHAHGADLLAQDTFSHLGSDGSDPADRMIAAGYTNLLSWAENLAWTGRANYAPDVPQAVGELHRRLFVDEGVDGRGHRLNLLDADLSEIGISVDTGVYQEFNSVLATMDFASTSDAQTFLTGVAYNDTVSNNDFYTPGEGIGGATVTAKRKSDGQIFTTTTWSSGGYTLALPAGSYTVNLSGGSLPNGKTTKPVTVNVGSSNVKLDFADPKADETAPNPDDNHPDPTPPDDNKPDDPKPTHKPDDAPPEADFEFHKRTQPSKNHVFHITYQDDGSGIDAADIGQGDVRVTNIKGFNKKAYFVDKVVNKDGSVTATYRVAGPGGAWDWTDNGKYAIRMLSNQVADAQGNVLPVCKVGVFAVRIPRDPDAAQGQDKSDSDPPKQAEDKLPSPLASLFAHHKDDGPADDEPPSDVLESHPGLPL